IGVELRHDRPYTKAINNKELSAVRVRLNLNALREQKDNGDIVGYAIEYAIDLQTDIGAFVEVLRQTIRGKASSGFKKSHRIDLPPAKKGWTIRIRRITPNRDSDLVADSMTVDALTEIIDAKLAYPCTALLGLSYDAKTFNNIAKLAVRLKGKIIQVPTNYNPDTRQYTGLWDGTFKMAYSNNPAWVFYDLCTHKRYGLGERLNGMVDKWRLYQIGQYCDELVDDGKGGKEPRFTVNVYIQQADDAYKVLQNLASVFRGMSFWDGQNIVVDSDTRKDPVYTFSPGNVVGGEFSYTGTRARDRHTAVKVAWDNPDNDFKTEYEAVQDEEGIATQGLRMLDMNAFGCTSRGQAMRAGLWALKSEQLETRSVTFKTGLQGFIPQVGQVINIADNVFAGRAISGRIVSVNGKQITLDRVAGKVGDILTIATADGVLSTKITAINDKIVTVNQALNVANESIWAIVADDLKLMQFRVLTIEQHDDATFSIHALQYEPQKFDAVDNGVHITPQPYSVLKATPITAPNSVTLTSSNRTVQGQVVTTLTINWEQVQGATAYIVKWRKDDGNWQTLPKISGQSVDIDGVYQGQYLAQVQAVDSFDNESLPTTSELTTIHGKTGKPPRLAKLVVKGILFGMQMDWIFAKGSDDTNFTQIEVSPDGRSNIASLGTFSYPTNSHTINGLQGNLTQFYRGRIVDKLGNTSDWSAWVKGVTDASADKVLDLLNGQITQSQLHQDLATPIGKIGALDSQMMMINAKMPTIDSQLAKANSDLTKAVADIGTQKTALNQAIVDINSLKTADNTMKQDIASLKVADSNTTAEINRVNTAMINADRAINQELASQKATLNNQTAELQTVKQTIVNKDKAQSLAVEKLNSRFDNLAVGGRNLLKHTEHLDQLWRFASGGQGNSMTISDGVARLTGVDNTWKHLGYDINKATSDAWLKDGTVFTLSIYAKKISGNPRLSIALRKGVTGGFKDDLVGKTFDLSNDWQKLVVSGTMTADDLQYLFVRFEFFENGIIELKKPKLEYGTVATDWTPALEDLQLEINSSNAKLDEFKTTQASKDLGLSQRIDTLSADMQQGDNRIKAELLSEQTARINADNTLSWRIDSLTADYNGNKATINSQIKALSDKEQALATSQNQLTAKFDNLKIGGRNLLVDSEFKQGKWLFAGHNNQFTHRIRDGVLTLGGNIPFWKHAKLTGDASWLNDVLQIGETYTFSVWARSTQGQKTVFISIRNWKDGQFSENIAKREQVGEIWQRIVVTSVYRQTPHNGQYLDVLLEHGEIGEVEFKQPKLEIGNVATDWTPAIQDNTAQTIITTATDLNTLTKTGKYFIKASTTNSLSQNWLFVDVENSGDDWIIKQTATQHNNIKNQWVRQRYNGNWGVWEKNATATDINASIDEVKRTFASIDTATAQQITTLQTTLNGQTSSIQTHAQSIDGLKAQYTVKVDSGGRVSGFGLASGGGVSDFSVRADKFLIAPPSGNGKGDSPFMVLTTPTNINGTVIPSGTYIKSAYIANGSINNAHIQDGSISNAKIANASISNAKIMDLSVSTLKIQDRAVTVPHTFTDTNPKNFENKRMDTFEKSEAGWTVPEISEWVLHGLTPHTEIMVVVDVGRLSMFIRRPDNIAYSKNYDCAVRLGVGYMSTSSPEDWDILNHAQALPMLIANPNLSHPVPVASSTTATQVSGAFFRRLTVPVNGRVDLKLWCSAYGSIDDRTIITAKTDKVTWYVLELKK
ncbi:TipJ family phage tail tip protein, partial [Faucicola boevrei]|uniref:TipJ family phage tail tip protein n=1 Tax=Faucicola boevrei TaxID=346665 RepID=UPI00037BF30D